MKILSIETSCDDTCLTLFEVKGKLPSPSFKIIANNSNSQIETHIPYGGVYPSLAKREHSKNLPILLEKTLKESKLGKKKKPVDLICVTYGPGLEPALWTGITFAQGLSKPWQVPVMPVNHMEGHILSVWGKNKGSFKIPEIKFPILSLLVSGGHTELVITQKGFKHEIIGRTLDDAAGEAFDKVARMLGLPYPGGPQISALAESARKNADRMQTNAEKIKFPRPMLKSKDFNFSFAGLKTAVLYFLKDHPKANKREVTLEFENAVIECLVYKTARALEKYKAKTLIVAGGVAANKHLRKEMKKLSKETLFPTPELSTDNSIMIGIAGYLNYLKNKRKTPKPESIKADGNLRL